MANITSIKFGTDKVVRANGGTITCHVLFDEDVQVTGTPVMNLINDNGGVGSGRVAQLSYVSGGNSDELTFSTTYGADAAAMPNPDDKLTIGANAIDLNGGTIQSDSSPSNPADITNVPQSGDEVVFSDDV